MGYRVGHFRKFVARCDISLGMVDPSNPPKIPANQVFEFDGFTIRMKDGRRFDKASGIQGMIEKGFVLLAQVEEKEQREAKPKVKPKAKAPSRKKKLVTKKEEEPRHALLQALDALEAQWESESNETDESDETDEDEDIEDETDDDFSLSADYEDEEDDDFGIIEDDEDDEDDDDFSPDDFDDDLGDEGVDLGNGITMRNQTRTVDSGRSLTVGSGYQSLEHSAKAYVGNTSVPISTGGAYVGSGGGVREKTASKHETISFDGAQVTQVVMQIPGHVGTRDSIEKRDVSSMSLNSIDYLQRKLTSEGREGVVAVGEGARIQEQLNRAEQIRKHKLDVLIQKRGERLIEIQKKIPNFKWDLRADPHKRFEKAIEIYKKSQTSKKAKAYLEAVIKYEIPEMRARINKEIEFMESPRRG